MIQPKRAAERKGAPGTADKAKGRNMLTLRGLGVVPDIVQVQDYSAKQQKRGHDTDADRSNSLRRLVDIPEQLFEKLKHR